jgi:SAM-dependent methyltransferase
MTKVTGKDFLLEKAIFHLEPMNESISKSPVDWTAQFEHWDNARQHSWRSYSDWIYIQWLQKWWPSSPPHRVLKTDLFDEAVGTGLMPWLIHHAHSAVGVDISGKIAGSARGQTSGIRVLAGDVRCLPFADHSFDLVFSPSTLDHFHSAEEIDIALRELHRVLSPGGKLFLSLDNLSNPIVRLRNLLPASLLIRWGVLPYPVGRSCTPTGLFLKLRNSGFSLCRSTVILHCPRVLAVPLLRFSNPRNCHRIVCCLKKFEHLSNWFSRYLTGYFIAVEAIRTE